jgi:aminoglycoside N3'-acetyltransferase
MTRRSIDATRLLTQLQALGVQSGRVLVVHTAYSKVGPVVDGPEGLIRVLQQAVGAAGTLVMPSMSDDDERLFDPRATACRALGIVADTFWRLPDVLRSDSPHAFAARGPRAGAITAAHPIEVPHGLASPIGRVYDLDGDVLLLGAGHDADTMIHLAENLAGVRYRLPKSVVALRDGALVRVAYGEIDHCCANFNLMDRWLDAHQLQRRGNVGHAEARLIRSHAIVATALARLRENETVFLHAPGIDSECDAARASLADSPTGPGAS